MASGQAIVIALGGNLPFEGHGSAETLQRAVVALNAGALRLRAVSRFFQTPCFPKGAGPDYVNAAAICTTRDGKSPSEVLQQLHAIEARYGRARDSRWGMRTLDLDLIAAGDRVLPDAATQTHWRDLPAEAQHTDAPDRLILPHPRLQDRAFVLVPLCDIAPDWRHPLIGRTVRQMADALPAEDRAAIVAM